MALFSFGENISRTNADEDFTRPQSIHRDHSLGYGMNITVSFTCNPKFPNMQTRFDVAARESNSALFATARACEASTPVCAFDVYTPHWGCGFTGLDDPETPRLVRGRYFAQLCSPSWVADEGRMKELMASHHIKVIRTDVRIKLH